MGDTTVEISVIVCSYNRAELLARGLYSLTDQDFPRDRYEIVVVDDGSTDATGAVLDLYASEAPHGHFRAVRIEKPPDHYRSPARARNVGLREARGWLVVLTDPECLATRRALSIHHRLHSTAAHDLIITTSPWLVSKEATADMDRVEWKRDVSLLSREFKDPLVRRAKIDTPWYDAHFISVKRYWAFLNAGVNERFESWGYESTDFSRRLHWHGLTHSQDADPGADVYHLWHDPVRGYGDHRMALIEGLLNGYDRTSVLDALAASGADLRGRPARDAYGRARLALLRLSVEELNAMRDRVLSEADRTFYPRLRNCRGRPPGDPAYGLDPWIGLRHLVDWEDYAAAHDWVNHATRSWPEDPGVLLEKGKLLLKLGRTLEAARSFKAVQRFLPDHPVARLGLKEAATLSNGAPASAPPPPESDEAPPTSRGPT